MASPFFFIPASPSDDFPVPGRGQHGSKGAAANEDARIDSNDTALVARIRGGDEPAFEQLFLQEYDALYHFAASITKSQPIAEEVVQDVMLRVWRNRSTWEPATGIRAYLFGAVRNDAYKALRNIASQARLTARFVGSAGGLAQPPELPDRGLISAELNAAIAAAIAALPPRGRDVFRLRRQVGLSYDQIASIMQISPKTVQEHMVRALRVLRQRLEGWDIWE